MRRGAGLAVGLLAGTVLDALVGDPRRGHPVAVFGAAAGRLEGRLWADSRPRGALFTLACVGGPVALGVVGGRIGSYPMVVTLATCSVLGARTLRRESAAIGALLEQDQLPAARERLTHLVGRDPSGLDAGEVSRAVVESVAENTSDAVVAPLFWGAVAGVPGLLGYRAINTLDAMVGHRSPRYERFGWASARCDDVANLVPARLTAALVVALGGAPARTARVVRRDGRRHPSPNSGWCESAFAGALDVRLGGENVYGARVERRPVLGDGRPVRCADLGSAAALSGRVGLAAAALAAAAAWRWR